MNCIVCQEQSDQGLHFAIPGVYRMASFILSNLQFGMIMGLAVQILGWLWYMDLRVMPGKSLMYQIKHDTTCLSVPDVHISAFIYLIYSNKHIEDIAVFKSLNWFSGDEFWVKRNNLFSALKPIHFLCQQVITCPCRFTLTDKIQIPIYTFNRTNPCFIVWVTRFTVTKY